MPEILKSPFGLLRMGFLLLIAENIYIRQKTLAGLMNIY